MAGSKFQYDESGGTFYYFLLSFLALVVIPCTYYFWPSKEEKERKERDRNICNCDPCQLKIEYLQANEPWKNVKRNLIKIAIILGWIAMIATAYKCDHLQADKVAFDPYEILAIDSGALPEEIKRAYRKLSLIYHPDKETGDQERFVAITKAYKALTDDTARENWEKYGNPDGPGATSFGIALPSWIVEKENSIFVLGLYALVFMIALPTVVGIWWYRSIKFNGDQVLLDTTNIYYYFIHKTDNLMIKRVIAVIAASLEFERGHNSEIIERPTDQSEVPNLIKEIPNLGESNKEKPLCYPYSIKARVLIYAHLSRLRLPPTTLELDKLYIVKRIPTLVQEFVQCVAQLTMLSLIGRIQRTPSLETLENAMKFCSMVVQGTWDYRNQLLQLPHITNANLKYFSNKKRTIRTIQQLALLREEDRRSMLSHLNDNQYEDIVNVIRRMPLLKVAARPEVIDDEDSTVITAGAMVTVTVSMERRSMQSLIDKSRNSSNATNPEDLLNEENEKLSANKPDENDQQANRNKPPVWKKANKKAKGKGKKKGGQTKKLPFQKQQQNNNQQQQQATDKKKADKQADSDEDDQSDSVSVVGSNDNSENENGSTTSADNGKQSAQTAEETSGAKRPAKKEGGDKNDSEDEEEWGKFQEKVVKKEKILESKSKHSHSVHCPYFSDDKQEYWWIYMVDRKRPALATIPVLMTNLVDYEEIELKFTAPTKPGTYKYEVIIRSDSYLDFSTTVNLKFEVEKAKIYEPPVWDISEEDEEEVEDDAVEDSDLESEVSESETEDSSVEDEVEEID